MKTSTVREITFDDYVECLTEHQVLMKEQNLIRSKDHEVSTIRRNKIALSWQDNERILLSHTTDTLPWGFSTCENDVDV